MRATVVAVVLLCVAAASLARERAISRGGYTYRYLASPARVEAYDARGWAATFTVGARAVTLRNEESRTFFEASAAAPVTHAIEVRLLSRPFAGTVDERWLAAALSSSSPDVLEIAMQYVAAAEVRFDASGQQVGGDADYGPLQPDGTRQEGSDFNDYLGVDWTYEDGSTDRNESLQINSLDCSGYVRIVFGYRSGLPLTLAPDGGRRLPRRAVQMSEAAPGVVVEPLAGTQVTRFDSLAPGDLLFFDVSDNDGTAIDHVGIYVGVDAAGRHRFVSSRKKANGPTLGDTGGVSLLDGGGLYAKAFRGARRL